MYILFCPDVLLGVYSAADHLSIQFRDHHLQSLDLHLLLSRPGPGPGLDAPDQNFGCFILSMHLDLLMFAYYGLIVGTIKQSQLWTRAVLKAGTFGGTGGGPVVAVAAAPVAGGGAAAAAPASEEKKEEVKEDSDEDLGLSLFD
ncbi:hypothetical protein RND71_030712 [Anisodus tanguticus]|uniref:Uncharacterized protein n=1 Tax=Anisodus tanguticus TaxID=243964 RepID=A0AAE1V7L3_9SOLA|nr:hypothetical protein RND71_030712 [Anisodus tanguticus]